jgi:hypothetical protein
MIHRNYIFEALVVGSIFVFVFSISNDGNEDARFQQSQSVTVQTYYKYNTTKYGMDKLFENMNNNKKSDCQIMEKDENTKMRPSTSTVRSKLCAGYDHSTKLCT